MDVTTTNIQSIQGIISMTDALLDALVQASESRAVEAKRLMDDLSEGHLDEVSVRAAWAAYDAIVARNAWEGLDALDLREARALFETMLARASQ